MNNALLKPVFFHSDATKAGWLCTAEDLDAELSQTIVGFVGSHLQMKHILEKAQADARAKSKTAGEDGPAKGGNHSACRYCENRAALACHLFSDSCAQVARCFGFSPSIVANRVERPLAIHSKPRSLGWAPSVKPSPCEGLRRSVPSMS